MGMGHNEWWNHNHIVEDFEREPKFIIYHRKTFDTGNTAGVRLDVEIYTAVIYVYNKNSIFKYI